MVSLKMKTIGKNSSKRTRILLALLIILEIALFLAVLQGSLGWMNRSFPGFLVMKNRIVAAAGCPFWDELKRGELLHAKLEAVNGQALEPAMDLNTLVGSQPPNSPVSYRLTTGSGQSHDFSTVTHRFTAKDFLALFGVYLLNGVFFLVAGLFCVWFRPRCSATPGFLAVGILASLWAFTACDLYGPYRFFRLHMLAESLLPAAILHLALVFPERLTHRRRLGRRLGVIYLAFLVFGVFYQVSAFNDQAYPYYNRLASAALGVALLALLARSVYAYFAGSRKFSKEALRSMLLFAVAALGPSIVIAVVTALQGRPPVSYVGYSSFLLPVGLAVALVQASRKPKGIGGMRPQHITITLFALLAALLLAGPDAWAGCGCDHPTPCPAPVVPAFASPGDTVLLTSEDGAFRPKNKVILENKKSCEGELCKTVRKGVPALDEQRMKVQVPKDSAYEDLQRIGPMKIKVKKNQVVLAKYSHDDFTLLSRPLVLEEGQGHYIFPDQDLAVDTFGVLYIPLDLSHIQAATNFLVYIDNLPLDFAADDLLIYNKAGFNLNLFTMDVEGYEKQWGAWYGAQGKDNVDPTQSDMVTYWRHDFYEYHAAHEPGGAYYAHTENEDGHLVHPDGTVHVNHDNLVVAVSGQLRDPNDPDNPDKMVSLEPGAVRGVTVHVLQLHTEDPDVWDHLSPEQEEILATGNE